MDEGQRLIRKAQPEHCSGELKSAEPFL